MSRQEPTCSKQDLDALSERLRRLPPRRVKELLDELGLDDPAADLERDYDRYEVLTLAPLAFEAECHLMRVEAVVERVSRAVATTGGPETGLQPILQRAIVSGRIV